MIAPAEDETKRIMLESELRDLLKSPKESANTDYKAGFVWDKTNRDKKYELIRDLLAMANTKDGGQIIFGIDDAFNFTGVSEEISHSIDTSSVCQMLHSAGDPKVSCEISKTVLDGKILVIFEVREFEDTPVICTDTIKSSDQSRSILRKGAIYMRTSAATTEEIPSAQEMRELLGRAMLKKGDELLGSIQRLLTGKPIQVTEDSTKQYKSEIDQADEFFKEKLGKGFLQVGRWEVTAYPTHYNASRIKELPTIEELIRACEVSLRGWTFPHTDHENAANFNLGRQSYIDWDQYREGYRFYRSALFVWKRAFWEDIEGSKTASGRRSLAIYSVIYSITEAMLFLKRVYERLELGGDVHVALRLPGCNDRKLASYDAAIHLWEHVCRVDTIHLEEDLKVVDLKAAHLDIAKSWIRRVFHIFNWNNVSDEFIERWQKKLIERRLEL